MLSFSCFSSVERCGKMSYLQMRSVNKTHGWEGSGWKLDGFRKLLLCPHTDELKASKMAPLPHPLAAIGPVFGFVLFVHFDHSTAVLKPDGLFFCILCNLQKVCLETSPLCFNMEKK